MVFNDLRMTMQVQMKGPFTLLPCEIRVCNRCLGEKGFFFKKKVKIQHDTFCYIFPASDGP